jgi:hypothetical protein
VQQIRIERKTPIRERPDRSAVLPLDPRDPEILRAKLLLRRGTVRDKADAHLSRSRSAS